MTLAAIATAPYADGQTWTRVNDDGDRIKLLDEIGPITTRVHFAAETLDTSGLEIRRFADGSLIALCGSFWDLVAESGDGWFTCDETGNLRAGIGEYYANAA